MLTGRDVKVARVRENGKMVPQEDVAAEVPGMDRALLGKIENGFPTTQEMYKQLVDAAKRLACREPEPV